MKIRLILFLSITASCLSIICEAQILKDWRPGKITLLDGQSFTAEIYYNLKKEELLVKTELETRTYFAKEVNSFELKSKDSIEVYYSLPFDMNEENAPLVFFQVLKEMPDFWLLSKKSPRETVSTPTTTDFGPNGLGPIGTARHKTYQPEILFLLTKQGKIEIYNSYNPRMTKSGLFGTIGKSLNTNLHLLETCTYPYFEKLQTYADSHHLNFEKKKDLLEILDYYTTLMP